jgi:2-methylcitrate dehydratase PrpD
MAMKVRDEVSRQLADFGLGLNLDAVPPAVIENATLHIIDALGIAVAGSVLPEAITVADTLIARGGQPHSTPFPFPTKLPASTCALLTGSLIHSFDFDDTHQASITHPSAPIVSAAMAIAEREGLSGREFLEAVIVGYETICRLGRAALGKFHLHGAHPTGVCGAPASALTVARLLRASPLAAANAISIAATFASGSSQTIRQGSPVKMLGAGRAAESGVTAAELAHRGFPGVHDVFEGELGFFDTFTGPGNYDLARVTDKLGEEWLTPDIEFKHYPAGFNEHPFMDAATKLKQRYSIKPADIDEIVYGDYSRLIPLNSEPVEQKRRPRTGYEAKFSRYFCISAVLGSDQISTETFSDASVSNPTILDLAARTRYEVEEGERWLRIVLKDGRTVKQVQDNPDPLSPDAVVAKFKANCDGVLERGQYERAATLLMTVETLPTVRDVVELLTSRGAR